MIEMTVKKKSQFQRHADKKRKKNCNSYYWTVFFFFFFSYWREKIGLKLLVFQSITGSFSPFWCRIFLWLVDCNNLSNTNIEFIMLDWGKEEDEKKTSLCLICFSVRLWRIHRSLCLQKKVSGIEFLLAAN